MTKESIEGEKTKNNRQTIKDNQQKHKNVQHVQQKKKIIRKFPLLKTQTNSPHDDQLKNWKPEKLNIKNQVKTKNSQQTKNTNIGISFLSSLPKPLNNQKDIQQANNYFIVKNQEKSNQNKKIKLSQQQLKWDAEDQFISKSKQVFKSQIKQQQLSNQQKFNQIDNQDQQIVQKIKWLNEFSNQKSNINLLKKLEQNWKKSDNQQQQDLDQISQNKKSLSSNKFKFNKN